MRQIDAYAYSNRIYYRLHPAYKAGCNLLALVLCLYNPRSHRRTEPFTHTCRILQAHLPAETPIGVVRAAFRPDQSVTCIPLADLPEQEVGMDAILIVGNASTRLLNGKMVTPRGYERKYDLQQGVE